MNTTGWSHNIAACWRNTEIFVHLNAFLCDCDLVSFGQLAKTLYVPPQNHSPWCGQSNYWNILLTGTYDFFGLNLYTAFMGKDGVEGGIPSRDRDMGVILSQDPNWPESASSWLRVCTFAYFCVHPHIYLFISSPYSQFLPINHSQHLSFFPLFIFRLSIHCTSKQHRHWQANSPSVSTKTASMARIDEILLLRSYHEPDEFCQHDHVLKS